ncbi:RNA-binding protein pno1-like [Paramacrobiotus metropolitanus]|uniref:RNA-binding protein pno1-like n=1 Tax=Paramacrobiotus metropolitanus TaxID=2943436 RepID=UPI002446269B|nr:RNA-binding protein pno1-like [Paramacrobiotus metropolitanus]
MDDLPDLEPVPIDVDHPVPANDAASTSTQKSKRIRKRKRRNTQNSAMEVDVEEVLPRKKSKWEGETDVRKVPVPAHRYTPLKDSWTKLIQPVVEHLHLQMRFNLKTRNVEIRPSPETEDIGALQKAADFVRAFVLGFEVDDAMALIRLDDLFIESFEITDVKPLKGDHLGRAIGRIAGKGGRTKFTIENVTKTRIVLADKNIHILGSFQNIQTARNAVCNLILGSPPSKVYGNMRAISSRTTERL